MTYSDNYKDFLLYINSYWNKIIIMPRQFAKWKALIRISAREKQFRNVLDVPNAFIAPNDQKFKHIFYWDTFFMLKGLMDTNKSWILKDMVGNFVYLFNKYGVIPNFNSPASTGRSQPPFLTSMILDAYNTGPNYYYLKRLKLKKFVSEVIRNNDWLQNAAETAKKEYFSVWDDRDSLFNHKVQKFNLNRYGDRDVGYAHSSELESGWDFTSRFYNRCNEFLPVDLNVYLYKYERDFADIASLLGDSQEKKTWKDRAAARRERINNLMWSQAQGFFFDYNYVVEKQSKFLSLAGFTPMWTGLATPAQAKRMVSKLKYFETTAGLTITAKKSLAPEIDLTHIPAMYKSAIKDVLRPKQWDYPHIWPPLEYLTVIGLLKYGYVKEASRIMKNSLSTQAKIFKKYKTFFEKSDARAVTLPANFHYQNQSGFGWTNAVFYRYVKILDATERGENIYVDPKPKQPPYALSIPH